MQADFRGRNLRGVNFTNSNFRGADLTKADLRGAIFISADLSRASLHLADCTGADFSMADMSMSYAKACNFTGARMWGAAIRHSMHKNAFYMDADLTDADFVGTNLLGARFDGATLVDVKNMDLAFFTWYVYPGRGPPSYFPVPGYGKLQQSITGGMTFQENAAREEIEKDVDVLDQKPSRTGETFRGDIKRYTKKDDMWK